MNRSFFMVLVFLFLSTIAATRASATTYWAINGGACVPYQAPIAASEYTNVGGAVWVGSTTPVQFVCPIPALAVNGPGIYYLNMTYLSSGVAVDVDLIEINSTTGAETTIYGNSGSSTSVTTASFPVTMSSGWGFGNYYYVLVTMTGRRFGTYSFASGLYGVSISV
ncbi:MAG TPA: hypothetical protein VH143_33915 [Kofleriaceae bacterium]|jgi:hypothetical protein|nr:hypothetical protein [Kofleriaceae bacterium]